MFQAIVSTRLSFRHGTRILLVNSSSFFHSAPPTLRKKKFTVPFSEESFSVEALHDKENTLEVKSQMLLPDPPRQFAKNIVERQMVEKALRTAESLRQERDFKKSKGIHEAARRRIVSGEEKLSYRQVQSLVKLNGLGKAIGPRELLEKRLLTFFQRMDPGRLKMMNSFEVSNIRCNLDGDNDNDEEYEKKKPAAEEDADELERLKTDLLKSFVADLEYDSSCKTMESQAKLKEQNRDDVMGAFYASPSKTGRAKCQVCGEQIAKNAIRVTHHHLSRYYHHYPKSWSPRHFEKHYHAKCFIRVVADDARQGVSLQEGTDVTEENASRDFLNALEEAIVCKNKEYAKDKEYLRLRSGAVVFSYPHNTLEFGRDTGTPGSLVETSRNGMFIRASEKVPLNTNEDGEEPAEN